MKAKNNIRKFFYYLIFFLISISNVAALGPRTKRLGLGDYSFSRNQDLALITNGKDLSRTRVELIEEAKRSIFISTFVASTGPSLVRLYKQLCRKSRAGVSIYIIMDSRGIADIDGDERIYESFDDVPLDVQKKSKHLFNSFEGFRACGIHIESYNSLKIAKVPFYIYAKHDKYLIVDGEKVLMGGSNMTESYSLAHKFGPYRYDADFLLKGNLACLIHRDFVKTWRSIFFDQVHKYKSKKKKNFLTYKGRNYQSLFDPDIMPGCRYALNENNNVSDERSKKADALFISNDPLLHSAFVRPLFDFYEQAFNKLQIGDFLYYYSPFFVPHKKLINSLINLQRKGVDVRIITNSLESTDSNLSYAASLNIAEKLLPLGIKIYLWSPKKTFGPLWPFERSSTLHRKVMLVGAAKKANRLTIVGSDNFDERGHNFSAEAILATHNEDIFDELFAQFTEDIHSYCKELSLKSIPYLKSELKWYERELVKNLIIRSQL